QRIARYAREIENGVLVSPVAREDGCTLNCPGRDVVVRLSDGEQGSSTEGLNDELVVGLFSHCFHKKWDCTVVPRDSGSLMSDNPPMELLTFCRFLVQQSSAAARGQHQCHPDCHILDQSHVSSLSVAES